ncbi:O-methyltransferase [Lentibacillus sp. CBA3610]|uniref:O-methyltransferase n=1 Tax=Lentibacillus sp. CBA3610 TaxID=2518176 RepID=UPI001595E1C3|nr:class I SAM-dependent methyltransferase [Lentibacillus sp. CBA3610]QKY68719.1 methyltransferase domain-containing protein [Lentibacillus sp. CBA3610]
MFRANVIEIPNAAEKIQREVRDADFTMSCDNETAALLRTLAASKRNSRFLELGTGAGYSTSWILEGMDKESRLTTVELDGTLHQIAKKHLGKDPRVEFVTGDGKDFINSMSGQTFDFIFADTWPGKLNTLDETLQLLNKGGFYIVDDLLPQKDWPEEHGEKIKDFIAYLDTKNELSITRLNWSTGLIIATKK